MRDIASRSFRVALPISGLLVLLGGGAIFFLETTKPSADQLQRLTLELEIFKAILAGIVVTTLGIFIPAVVTETRELFQQRKDSRIAYSLAKTASDYLKLRLASADFDKACEIVQDAHYRKHVAELFDDFPMWLKRRYTYIQLDPGQSLAEWWDETMYKRLSRTREILEEHAMEWPLLTTGKRIQLLAAALPEI